MIKEPWDLPMEESSKPILAALIAQYESEQKAREAGICCSRMANLEKQFGPFDSSAEYGQKAVFYLRQSDDKKELARALRAACVPFTMGINQAEYLNESLAFAREAGSRLEEAHTIFRFTRAFTPTLEQMNEMEQLDEQTKADRYKVLREQFQDGHTIEEALAIYEEVNDASGIAMCLVSLGVERKPSDRTLFDRAITLYEQVGETEAANKARMMAEVFCS